ncbi:hypothetical protein [Vallitalea okinawensis]|uniref:hypothetical protein n=1 Tax=Vallitalea okinawensis TaxID=2078660 RepID=UPI000CFA8881|nr:hypothetical protein [Vallitalea okinawensis]
MKKKLVMLGSVLPSVIVILSLVFAAIIVNSDLVNQEIPVSLRSVVILWLILLLVSVLLLWGFIIGYIVHIFAMNKELIIGKKIIWTVCIWFFSFITIPIYWYIYLRNDERNKT